MDASGTILWTGVAAGGTELFRAYTLRAGPEHLSLSRTITGRWSIGRVTRVKILDDQTTAGSAWYGERPDIFLLTTSGTGSSPAVTYSSVDWAFDCDRLRRAHRLRATDGSSWPTNGAVS